jgi:hypothetical protein
MVPKTLAAAIRKWPTADLAELLLLVKSQLDKRADHHAKGGGVEAELAKRSKSRSVASRSSK